MKLQKYTNEIYTIPVYVGYLTKESDIKDYLEEFTFLDFIENNTFGKEDVKGYLKEDLSAASAVTWRAQNKDGAICALILIVRKKEFDNGTAAHEAFHALQIMMTEIGLDFSRVMLNEHLAYLIGWITNCIDKFVKGK